MKTVLIIVGVALVAFGGIALVNEGISYTREEQVVDIGPIEASAQTRETLEIPVWGAIAALAIGGGFLVAGVRQKA